MVSNKHFFSISDEENIIYEKRISNSLMTVQKSIWLIVIIKTNQYLLQIIKHVLGSSEGWCM